MGSRINENANIQSSELMFELVKKNKQKNEKAKNNYLVDSRTISLLKVYYNLFPYLSMPRTEINTNYHFINRIRLDAINKKINYKQLFSGQIMNVMPHFDNNIKKLSLPVKFGRAIEGNISPNLEGKIEAIIGEKYIIPEKFYQEKID